MFEHQALASTEYYQHRFRNFSTMTILPATMFVIALLGFMLIAKREVTVRTVGELTPKTTPISVQSTGASRIVANHLKEGKTVAKGQTLVIYHDAQTTAQTNLLKLQQQHLTKQMTALGTLRRSVENNRDEFSRDDEFGYRQLLNDYLAQRRVYLMESKQISVAQGSDNDKAVRVQMLLQAQINKSTDTQSDDQRLLSAIEEGSGYPANGMHHALYNNYLMAIKGLVGDEREKVVSTYAQQLQSQIDTLDATISDLKIQLVSAAKNDTSSWQTSAVNDKIQALQAVQLKDANAESTQVKEQLEAIATKLAQAKDASKNYRIKAPASGILHINTSVSGNRLIAAGTQLAQIMPEISKQRRAKLSMLVSPNVVTSLYQGQTVRLRIARDVPTPVILSGRLSSVAVGPTITKSGNLFQVVANVALTPQLTKQLHYGMAGQASIITGKKTYWQYVVDRLFNRE